MNPTLSHPQLLRVEKILPGQSVGPDITRIATGYLLQQRPHLTVHLNQAMATLCSSSDTKILHLSHTVATLMPQLLATQWQCCTAHNIHKTGYFPVIGCTTPIVKSKL